MALLPTLLRKSEESEIVETPRDFGLEQFIKKIFQDPFTANRRNGSQDIVYEPVRGFFPPDQDKVYEFAKYQILLLDQNPENIANNQEVFEYFLQNPELVEFILNPENQILAYVNNDEQRLSVCNYFRIKSHIDFLENINNLIAKKNSRGSSINDFKGVLESILNSQEFLAMKKIIEYSEQDLTVKISFRKIIRESNHYDEGYYITSRNDAELITSSGQSYKLNTRTHNLLEMIMKEWKGMSRPVMQSLLKSDLDVEISISGTEYEITAKCKGSKFLGAGAIASKICSDIFYLKESIDDDTNNFFSHRQPNYHCLITKNIVKEFLMDSDILPGKSQQELLQQINSIKDNLIELRYLAVAAKFYREMQEKGYQTATPIIRDCRERILKADRMLNPSLVAEGKEVVANDINLDIHSSLAVLTGPNYGGKTVFLSAVGMNTALAQAGLRAFADYFAFSPKDQVLSHYRRATDIVEGDSAYKNELERFKRIIEKFTHNSLLLFDESCTATDPRDGIYQNEVILKAMETVGANAIVSTHYHELASRMQIVEGVQLLKAVAYREGGNLIYTYRIEPGLSKESNGTDLARKLGIDMDGMESIINERFNAGQLELKASTQVALAYRSA